MVARNVYFTIIQVFIAKSRKKSEDDGNHGSSHSFKCKSDNSIINNGSIVAVYLAKYPEFPQIGQVRSSTDTTITISWYDGTFNDIWSLVKLKKGEEWKETINKSSVLLFDIVFTKGPEAEKGVSERLL